MRRKLCAEMVNEFDVWLWKAHSRSISSDRWNFDCVKAAVKLKNLKIIVICKPLHLAHLIVIEKYVKCRYQFLINFHPIDFWGFKTMPFLDLFHLFFIVIILNKTWFLWEVYHFLVTFVNISIMQFTQIWLYTLK